MLFFLFVFFLIKKKNVTINCLCSLLAPFELINISEWSDSPAPSVANLSFATKQEYTSDQLRKTGVRRSSPHVRSRAFRWLEAPFATVRFLTRFPFIV